jgi:two-component system chemotaxis sensor kinase CheA
MSTTPCEAQTGDQFRVAFREEALDLLRQLESLLLSLGEGEADPEQVSSIFRMLHTVKGSGAMFGFTILSAFTHDLENAFDAVRGGRLVLSRDLIEITLEASDVMRDLVLNDDAGEQEPRMALVGRVRKLVAATTTSPQSSSPSSTLDEARPAMTATSGPRRWRIEFAPGLDTMRYGADPALLVRELGRMGSLRAVVDLDALPSLAEIDPERCYMRWKISLHTDADLLQIREVFLFVEDTCELSIEPETEDVQPAPSAAVAQPAPENPADATVIAPQVTETTQDPRSGRGPRRPQDMVENATAIRVATGKLDQLVNLVGELVTVQARLSEIASRYDDGDISAVAEEIERLSAALRESSMSARMMPIRDTFERFRRLVYDLARDLGKNVRLSMEGCETELDKTVLDQLGDPLMHLIRNSMDHGLETTDQRAATGKPVECSLRLHARYSGANVLITVSDDGRGIDSARVRQRAVEKGIIAADAALTEAEVFGLIFEPGFSTASEVTDLSGRGVGMDVVRRNIEHLRGSIEVVSHAGKGTSITLRIPLTLAIIDGLLVSVGEQYFVLPLAQALECIEISRSEIDNAEGKHLIKVRGEVVAYIRLRDYFGIEADLPEFEQVMLVTTDAGRYGLVVDRVLGDCQTMVKSLGRLYRNVNELSGATVLGNGGVALILDPHRLVQECIRGVMPATRLLARSPVMGDTPVRASTDNRNSGSNSPKIVPISQTAA